MKKSVVFLTILLGLTFSQTDCYSEKLAGESCYKDCCESLGYSWGEGGCLVSGSAQDDVTASCGYCTDSYIECMEGSGSKVPSSSESGPGCCSGFIVLSLLAVPAFLQLKR